MKKKINIFIILLISFLSVHSQKKADSYIKGHVVQKSTQEHIPFVNIALKGTTIAASTDASGHFMLKNIPVGKYTVIVSGVGFKSSEKEVILLAGKGLEVTFELEEDVIQLDNVVVSANRNETNRREAPSIVNVITPKLFENTNSVCLAQGLNYQPGLRVESNCQNCGFQQVRINGLEGPYSQILIDSRPIFSSLASVYGIEQIPANMIERVEVMRGGGSALFGSNAIAGTINIITKEPVKNSLTIANSTNVIYGKAPDYNTSLNASLVSEDYRTGIFLFGSSRQRSPFDYDGDGFTEIGKIQAQNIGFRAYYKTSAYGKFVVEYHNLNEFRRGGNNLDLPPHETDITEQTEHVINSGSIKYDAFSKNLKHRLNLYASAQKTDRESYYGAGKNPNAYGKTNDITYVTGIQYSYSIDTMFFMPSELTAGTEYSYNDLEDQMLGYHRTIEQSVNTKSIFLQNEWKNKKISILLGFRMDKHNLIEDPIFSPRVNFRYNPSENVNFRASYSSGFRAPQAFDEDLHVTAVGGNVSLIRIDPNLKTEKSKSISASVDLYKNFGSVQTNLLVEAFYTDLDNVFLLEEVGKDSAGNIILERRNGSGAVVKGINIEGKVVPAKKFQFQFGFTLQSSRYKKDQVWSDNSEVKPQRKMFRSPDYYGYLTANYQPLKQINVALSGTYTGSMLVQHYAGYVDQDQEKETPAFYDMNIKFSYDFILNEHTTLQLNCGVQNIFNSYQDDFDQGEFRDAGYIYGPSLPRTLFIGVKLAL